MMDDLIEQLRLAWEALEGEGAFADAAGRALCEMRGETAALRVAGREALINPGERRAAWADGTPMNPVAVAAALRYIAGAREEFPRGRQLPFRKLPGAADFADDFRERVLEPLAERFGAAPKSVARAGLSLGGRVIETMGDAAVEVTIFPRIPVTCVVWGAVGDDAPAANMYFDVSVSAHLDARGVLLAAEALLAELSRAAGF